ncbi:MAG: PA14 domain-containing protein, partial [Phycisphaerae bacterium]
MTSRNHWKTFGAAVVALALLGAFGTPRVSADPGLVSHYKFDETAGATEAVDSADGNHGTIMGDPALGHAGVFGSSYYFDGNNDYVDLGADTFGNPGVFTWALWFKREADRGDATNHGVNNVLLAQSSNSSNDNFELGSDDNDLELYLDSGGGSADATVRTTIGDDGITTDWHHVAMVYDQNATNAATLYFDGEFAAEWDQFGGTLDGAGGTHFTIGIARPGGNEWGDFQGWMDDVRWYDTALDADGIAALAARFETQTWDFATVGDGNWNTPANWSLEHTPTADEVAEVIGDGVDAADTLTLDTTESVTRLSIGTNAAAPASDTNLHITGAADLTVSENVYLGMHDHDAAANVVTQDAGSVSIAGDLVYGTSSTGIESGTYNLAGGSLEVQGTIRKADPAVAMSTFAWTGGTLRNLGSYGPGLEALEQDAGTMQPGGPGALGTTLIDNDYTVGDGGGDLATWDMELDPDAPQGVFDAFGRQVHAADRIDVTGTLALASDSDLALGDVSGAGWGNLADNMVFILSRYGTLDAIQDTFGSTNLGTLPGGGWEVDYAYGPAGDQIAVLQPVAAGTGAVRWSGDDDTTWHQAGNWLEWDGANWTGADNFPIVGNTAQFDPTDPAPYEYVVDLGGMTGAAAHLDFNDISEDPIYQFVVQNGTIEMDDGDPTTSSNLTVTHDAAGPAGTTTVSAGLRTDQYESGTPDNVILDVSSGRLELTGRLGYYDAGTATRKPIVLAEPAAGDNVAAGATLAITNSSADDTVRSHIDAALSVAGVIEAEGNSLDSTTLTLQDGGALHMTGTTAMYQAGLWWGQTGGNMDQGTPNPETRVTLNPSAEADDGIPGNTTEIMTGQIFDADGVISFTEHIDDKAAYWIDGTQVLFNDSWNTRSDTGKLEGDAGWHEFEIRISNGGGGSGTVGGIGLGYDVDGGTAWAPILDPGDGSFLRSTQTTARPDATDVDVIVNGGSALQATGEVNLGHLTLNHTGALAVTPGGADNDNVSFLSTTLEDTPSTAATINNDADVAGGPLTLGDEVNTLTKQGTGDLSYTDVTEVGPSPNGATLTLDVQGGRLDITGRVGATSLINLDDSTIGTGATLSIPNSLPVSPNDVTTTPGHPIVVDGGRLEITGSYVEGDTNSSSVGDSSITLGEGATLAAGVDVPAAQPGGLVGEYFFNPGGISSVNQVDWNRDPQDTRIDGPVWFGNDFQKFGEMGQREDNFGVRWTGFLLIDTPGDVQLWCDSDDGSILWMDLGEGLVEAVNCDGLHGTGNEVSATINFPLAGLYPVDLRMFEQGGGEGMELGWIDANTAIPADHLFNPDLTTTVELPNSLTIAGNATLEVDGPLAFEAVAFEAGGTLNVVGEGGMEFANTDVSAAATTGTVNAEAMDVYLARLTDGGSTDVHLTKTGPYAVVFEETSEANDADGATLHLAEADVVAVGGGVFDPLDGAAASLDAADTVLHLASKSAAYDVSTPITVTADGTLLAAMTDLSEDDVADAAVSLDGTVTVNTDQTLSLEARDGYTLTWNNTSAGDGSLNLVEDTEVAVTGSVASLTGIDIAAGANVTAENATALGSSNEIVVREHGWLALNDIQTNFPSSVTVEGLGLVSEEVGDGEHEWTGATYGTNTILNADAILGLEPDTTGGGNPANHPTLAGHGECNLWLAATDLDADYPGIGPDDGTVDGPAWEGVYKGIVFDDRVTEAGALDTLLAQSAGGTEGFEVRLHRDQTFDFGAGAQVDADALVDVTNDPMPQGVHPHFGYPAPTWTLAGTMDGTATEYRRKGTEPVKAADDPEGVSRPGTMGQEILAFSDQENSIPSDTTLTLDDGILRIDTAQKIWALAYDMGDPTNVRAELNVEADATLVLGTEDDPRTMQSGMTNLKQGAYLYVASDDVWTATGPYGFRPFPVMSVQDGVNVIVDGYDPLFGDGSQADDWPQDVALNYIIADDGDKWADDLPLGNGAFAVTARDGSVSFEQYDAPAPWTIRTLTDDGSVQDVTLSASAGNEMTIRTDIDLRNGDGDERATLHVGFAPGTEPFVPGVDDLDYSQAGSGSVRIRAAGTASTHHLGDVVVEGGELEFGYNYDAADYADFEPLSPDIDGTITVRDGATLTVQGRYVETIADGGTVNYQAHPLLFAGDLGTTQIVENGGTLAHRMRNVTDAGEGNNLQEVSQAVRFEQGTTTDPDARTTWIVDEEFRGADRTAWDPTSDTQHNSDGYYYPNVAMADAYVVLDTEHVNRNALHLDLDLAGTSTLTGDNASLTGLTGTGTLNLGDQAADTWDGDIGIDIRGALTSGTLVLQNGEIDVHVDPGSALVRDEMPAAPG